MKFLRFLFGRFFIITLLVIVQAAAFVLAIVYLDRVTPYYYYINAGFSALGVLIVLVLVNRRINPNYIVPWIVIVLIFPVVGVVVYLMFSQNRLSRSQKKRYRKIFDSVTDYVPQSQSVADKLNKTDRDMYGQSRYLLSANKLPVYDDTQCRYYPTGEEFFAALKDELKKARKYIFMEYFVIKKGVMWDSVLKILMQKVNEGVEVRFMYDDIGSISTVSSNYCKKLRKLGIKCVKFNKFLPVISAVHNNRDHRKMTVIDGKVGFMGGANLSDEYINVGISKKCGYWKDSAIKLTGGAARSMAVMFLQMYNAQTKSREDFAPYLSEVSNVGTGGESGHGFIQPFGDGPMPLYLEKVSQTAILNMINQAENYVYITTPYLIVDFQLMDAIKRAAKRGVDATIITPHIPDKRIIFLMTRSSYRPLIQAGVKIYEYLPGFIHSKNFLADDKAAIVGTINMDYRSLVHHFECGVWMHGVPCISDIKKDFAAILSVSRRVSDEESRLNPFQKAFRVVLELFAPLL
ncbi:MAG: cardiolipin synthase [Firmicutes bacterium]|nr:cardiolipin synthase [Bacillota bacterium]